MTKRFQATVSGRVQGVGFRPTVWRYASDSGLSGFVKNDPSGVIIEAEGDEAKIAAFFDRIKNAPPEQARIERIEIK
ncbi:MAG: acylphosphatase, partial [Planctomycetota bacterium]